MGTKNQKKEERIRLTKEKETKEASQYFTWYCSLNWQMLLWISMTD